MEFWSQQLWDRSRYIPFWKTVRQRKILRIGFQKTDFKEFLYIYSKLCFHTFCLIYPALSNKKNSKYWFPHGLSFLQVSRKRKYFTLCFPHFLFDVPSSVRQIANISSYVFHTFCMIYPALSDENFLRIGFHKTCHLSDFKELQTFQVMFTTLFVWYT